MDGRKFRFRDNHEFFHAACSAESRRQIPVQDQAAFRSQRLAPPLPEPPHPDEHHRHCTAGEIASELGYSVSYILAVKKAMYSELAKLPRRLDPKEVSDWFYAHPAFRMRDVVVGDLALIGELGSFQKLRHRMPAPAVGLESLGGLRGVVVGFDVAGNPIGEGGIVAKRVVRRLLFLALILLHQLVGGASFLHVVAPQAGTLLLTRIDPPLLT